MGHAVDGGFYDRKLGPIDDFDTCVTCGLKGRHCPGHPGHVVLEVPTFNPVYFPFMYNVSVYICVYVKYSFSVIKRHLC